LERIAGSIDIGAEDLTELMRRQFGFAGGELIGDGEVAPTGSGSYAEGPVFWEVCVGAAEVHVDPETGLIRVLRTATAADVGRAINPQLVERQDEGATMQGIGNALFEEMVYEEGLLLNDTLLDYRIPSFEDLPDGMTCVIVENGDGPGPYGANGGGIRFESDFAAALEGADFVIEAVPEKLELKQELFPQFEAAVADDTILASNTSGIPITKLAAVCSRPERVVGMHWSNPPHLIPMIEVIPGEK